MEPVIRPNQNIEPRPIKAWGLWAIILGVVVLILGAAFLAASNAIQMGWPALILFGGMSLVGGFGLLSFVVTQRNKLHSNDRRFADRGSPYADAFFRNPLPSLIVSNGKPAFANDAYTNLAKDIGFTGASASPPSIDRLFSGGNEKVSAAIFRLHRASSKGSEAKEIIDIVNKENAFRRYHIDVKLLGEDQLWIVKDVTRNPEGEGMTLVDAPVGLFSITREGHVLAVNSVLSRWLGGDEILRPGHIKEFIEDADVLLNSSVAAGRVIRSDTRLITRKGVVTPTIMVGSWHKLENGDDIASVALYGHSSRASNRSSSLGTGQTSKLDETIAAGFASAPVAVLQLDGESLGQTSIISANTAFEDMSTNVAWKGLAFKKIFLPSDTLNNFLSKRADQCEAGKPFDATLAGSKQVPVSVYVVPDPELSTKSWVYMVDVSARKSLEDQLVQSQKMQAIGQLAAGVAHDFNNLLTAIRLNTDELLQRHPVGDPSYPELQNINTTGIRAAALVKKLLAFSRKQTRRAELLNVTDTLSDMAVTLKQTLGERAVLKMVHGRGLSPILADKSQIDTVLMNLCVNARDAMEEQGGGSITIKSAEVSRTDITDESVLVALKDTSGESFITIDVTDTGTGMTDKVKSKIFEPFFTTKEQGKGTGLGLATVYGIVQQSGGHLTVDSRLGKGTTFRMYLLAADPSQALPEPVVKAPVEARKPVSLSGQGTILFVEDEASVRLIAAKTLRKRGYKVIEAEDGEEAFEILEDGEHDFDLLISDVVMPGMDGPTLLKKGRTMLKDARIVFISGYAEEEFSELLSEEPDVTFLPKPFTLAQLAEKVKTEIGESEA